MIKEPKKSDMLKLEMSYKNIKVEGLLSIDDSNMDIVSVWAKDVWYAISKQIGKRAINAQMSYEYQKILDGENETIFRT